MISEDNDVSRRNVLNAVGASAIGGLALGTMTDSVAASPSPTEYTEVTGNRKKELIKKAKTSEEYKEFKHYFKSESSAKLNPKSATVVSVENRRSGVSASVVDVPLKKHGDADVAGVAVVLEDGAVVSASASSRKIESSTVQEETITVEKYTRSGGEIVRHKETFDRTKLKETASTGDFTATASLECDACKATYSALAAVGCGLTLAAICAAAGIGTGGAAFSICGVVVTALCGAGSQFDYGTYSPEEFCSGEAAGYEDLLWC